MDNKELYLCKFTIYQYHQFPRTWDVSRIVYAKSEDDAICVIKRNITNEANEVWVEDLVAFKVLT